ncbi:MAG: DUF190 domain-containing protein [Candidatus Accumulibacter sp.]|uniref:DUF190 domain-containing protein n=1 Tax=Accumulibacter sp. TaxID=2053492 RepID=UPI00287A8936|nr:DUF190 domain-containing protein [Accumulibacter sp.]MDS4014595.1 DUF190 domain-containing protein [Accumulibacter sp.]
MQGSFIRFYLHATQTHRAVLLWEWLLAQGNQLGLRGGSAFRAIGGFGRRHTMHEERFFELAGDSGVEVEFVVTTEEEERLLDLLRSENVRLFYTRIPATFGIINPDDKDTLGAPEASSFR